MISRWYNRQECKLISFNNFINTQCCKCLVSFVYGNITTPRSTALLYTPMRVKFLLLLLRGLTVFDCGSENVTFFFFFKSFLSESDLYSFDIQAIFHFHQRSKIQYEWTSLLPNICQCSRLALYMHFLSAQLKTLACSNGLQFRNNLYYCRAQR